MSDAGRVLLAATKSGSGKTTITCGIIKALKSSGKKVASLKCGPDYIDPMFHRKVLGIDAGNIDTFFADDKTNLALVKEHTEGADITIIEGVMGYYDGLGGVSTVGSAYDVSRVTKTPVVLIVDAKGASVTLAATIKGIVDFKTDSNVKGVILNRVSQTYYERIKNVIEEEASVKVIGFVPEIKEMEVPSRHLGLVSPDEISSFDKWINNIADVVIKHVDMNALLEIAALAETLDESHLECPKLSKSLTVAVARDEAFSFYYKENLDLLKKMGANLINFSPLHDVSVPKNADVILLGGGYPELYAEELSKNSAMLESINTAIKAGTKIIAECGGFMYLMDELSDAEGKTHKMVGTLSGKAYNTGKLARFGYIELDIAGCKIKAHEFHKWDTTNNGEAATAKKPLTDNEYKCMHVSKNMMVGYPHIYYYSNIDLIYKFLEG